MEYVNDMDDFIRQLQLKYGYDNPIFTFEIINLFFEYSIPWVNVKIKSSVKNNSLIIINKGCYFIPQTKHSIVNFDMVKKYVEKKYIKDEKNIFGIYSGDILLNDFCIKNNTPKSIDVVSNKPSALVKSEIVNDVKITIRKSRYDINNENEKIYTFLEVFSILDVDMFNNNERIAKEKVKSFADENNITLLDVFKKLKQFP